MNKRIVLVLLLVSLMASGIITIQPIKADSRTIIVPDDYPTIAAAIGNATDGDTILVRKGTYEGAANQTLKVDKAISLIGESVDNTKINLHPPLVPQTLFTQTFMVYSSPIEIASNGVELSGFTLTTPGGDISATGDRIKINDNNITTGLTVRGSNLTLAKNTVKNAITTIGSNQFIAQNTVAGSNGEYGISVAGSYNTVSANIVLRGTQIEGSRNVVFSNSIIGYSNVGVGLSVSGDENFVAENSLLSLMSIRGSRNTVFANNITGNLGIVGNNNTLYANYIQGLVLGNRIKDASYNTFYHNNFDFVANEALPPGEKTLTVWSGVQGPNFFDNGKEGNYWSDYTGKDNNNDGLGDTPYVTYANDTHNYEYVADFNIANIILTDNYPLMAPFDISTVTVQLPEWTLPSPVPSPTQEPTPFTQATPALTSPATVAPSTSELPTQTNNTQPLTFPQELIYIIAIAVTAIILVALFFVVLRKRNRHILPQPEVQSTSKEEGSSLRTDTAKA